MTLPSSGAISMSQVNTEFNRSATGNLDMNSAAFLALCGKTSGARSLSDCYGQTGKFPTKATPSQYGTAPNQTTYVSLAAGGASLMRSPANAQTITQWLNGSWYVDYSLNSGAAAPIYTGQFAITNNTTGITKILTYQGAVTAGAGGTLYTWRSPSQASRDDNFLRVGTGDSFTLYPYF